MTDLSSSHFVYSLSALRWVNLPGTALFFLLNGETKFGKKIGRNAFGKTLIGETSFGKNLFSETQNGGQKQFVMQKGTRKRNAKSFMI